MDILVTPDLDSPIWVITSIGPTLVALQSSDGRTKTMTMDDIRASHIVLFA